MANTRTTKDSIAAIAAALKGSAAGPATDWSSIDTPVKHEGREIRLPATPTPMGYDDAILTIERVRDQENQKFDANEVIQGAPFDALVAVFRAIQDIYGVVLSSSMRTFFGEILPDMVTVNTGPAAHEKIQVPMGQINLPNVPDPVNVGIFPGGVVIRGKVRRADRTLLVDIVNRAREFLREQSIYRGRAIRLAVDEEGSLQTSVQPEFLDLTRVSESDMIHSAETALQIRTSIMAPLKNTEACRKHKIPLKRGILLEGKYGTGKSLTARVVAKVATDNGWTFILLNRAQGLKAAIDFARTYQPCVIFAEDIDRAADREDEDVNDLVNLLDGVVTKDMEMMVVLTTNFIEKIDRALLRPGRFDSIVSIQPPDASAAMQLVRHYSRELLDPTADLAVVGETIEGWIPATIREVVERAKLSMLVEDRERITSEDLIAAAIGMKRHTELLEPKDVTVTPAEQLYGALKTMVTGAILGEDIDGLASQDSVDTIRGIVGAIHSYANDAQDRLRRIDTTTKAGAQSAEYARSNTLEIKQKIGA
jgi:transitional endoplasmic reticulum ATPase